MEEDKVLKENNAILALANSLQFEHKRIDNIFIEQIKTLTGQRDNLLSQIVMLSQQQNSPTPQLGGKKSRKSAKSAKK